MAGKMAFENRAGFGNLRLRFDGATRQIEFDDSVDELKILEPHGGAAYAPFAATRPSMLAQRLLRTKYCSVVALPSLTSCVHCSSGNLIPKALSMAKAMSRKSRLSMPRSLMA